MKTGTYKPIVSAFFILNSALNEPAAKNDNDKRYEQLQFMSFSTLRLNIIHPI